MSFGDGFDFDTVFAEAQVATKNVEASGQSTRRRRIEDVASDPEMSRRMASQLRSQIMRTQHFEQREIGACTTACRQQVRHFNVRMYRVVTADPTVREAACVDVGNWLVHACVEDICFLGSVERLHVDDITDEWRHSNGAIARAMTEGGGAHWCARHTRMHVCTTADCRQSVRNALGFAVCMLSGRTVSSSARQQFGHGTTVLSAAVHRQREQAQRERREENAVQRSSMAAVERVVRAGNTQVDQLSPGNRPLLGARARRDDLKRRRLFVVEGDEEPAEAAASSSNTDNHRNDATSSDDESAYIDLDEPSDDLFGNTLEENTFGDDIAQWLVRSYAQAYATVHLMLFSKERSEFESNVRMQAVKMAEGRLNTYLTAESKPGRFISLPLMRQLEMRALNSKKHLPVLLLTENATKRLTAYYAMIITEFYAQLLSTVAQIKKSLHGTALGTVERFTSASAQLVTLAPNVLDLMHEGLSIDNHTIIGCETLLHIYPEVQTMNAIGIDTKRCTESMKMLKQLVNVIGESSVSIDDITTTVVDPDFLLFSNRSVIAEFLRRRRSRIHMDDDLDDDGHRL
jgi:hypothetical protein